MYIYETFLPLRERNSHRDYKQAKVSKKYFYKNGHNKVTYDWFTLFWAIREFKLMFRFKYNLQAQQLSAAFVPRHQRWANQMGFLKFYLKLFKRMKWHEFEPRKLTSFLRKAKRACYSGLLETIV